MTKKPCTAPDIECPRAISPRVPRDLKMCDPCYDYAGWENMHSDNGHDKITTKSATDEQRDEIAECPVCDPSLDPRNEDNAPAQKPVRRGHTNKNAAGKHMSHAACSHESSKSARALCRKTLKSTDNAAVLNADVLEIKIPTCPKCDAKINEKCTTKSGGRFKGKGGRHPEHPANAA